MSEVNTKTPAWGDHITAGDRNAKVKDVEGKKDPSTPKRPKPGETDVFLQLPKPGLDFISREVPLGSEYKIMSPAVPSSAAAHDHRRGGRVRGEHDPKARPVPTMRRIPQ